jgi:DNA polymerase III subunit gamma/tau
VSQPLALKYRPTWWADVAGQTPSIAVLYRMAALRTVPTALIFTGLRGTGKTTTARILAAAMNCEAGVGPPDQWPCRECASCKSIMDGTSLDVTEIDAASNGGVEQIRKLREMCQYSTPGADHVVILDEVHSCSRDAFNALLKTLEEPPPDTTFILLTTEVGKVLPTVFSRCMEFPFRALPIAAIVKRLRQICDAEGLAMDQELLLAIAERAEGAMRDAVVALDQVARVGVTDVARWRALTGSKDFAPVLVGHMIDGDFPALYAELDKVLQENGDFAYVTSKLVFCLRDLLVLQGGGTLTAGGSALALRQTLAGRTDATRVASAMRVLWDLRTKVARIEPRASLELAVTMCAERLAQPKESSRPDRPRSYAIDGTSPNLARLREMANGSP